MRMSLTRNILLLKSKLIPQLLLLLLEALKQAKKILPAT